MSAVVPRSGQERVDACPILIVGVDRAPLAGADLTGAGLGSVCVGSWAWWQGHWSGASCTHHESNPSRALVILFWRWAKSVLDVLDGINRCGFTEAQLGCTRCVAMDRLVRFGRSNLGHTEHHQISTFFCEWAVEAMEVLNPYVRKVVIVRKEGGVRSGRIQVLVSTSASGQSYCSLPSFDV